ncbi:MAG: ATP-binding protein [Gammaproteobacteria bacterium]|nr:ATP-binding protein [Gammaproteobacteria bacterium]MDE0286070.1 ATP-binding protein [Gammaproteobacteria bacterium]
MATRYTDPGFTTNLLCLFVPGSGALPPVLAGRDDDLRVLQGFLQRLLNNRQIPADVVIYGPRGNGKTVLLESFRRQCEEQGTDTLDLTPAALGNVTDLAAHLLYDDSAIGKFLTSVTPSGLSIDLQAIGARWDSMTPVEKDNVKRRHLVQMLLERCRKRPLVVALDEAHTLAAEVGHTLLNASQQARKQGAPFLLVVAGTPNLRDHLNQMSATFWNRAEKIGIGRLSREATIEALAAPLAGAGITFDQDALDRVVRESQRYPYFIQLWGEALCHAMVDAGRFRVQTGIVEAAGPRFEASKTAYYGDRYRELRKQGLLQAAGAVADLFAGQETAGYTDLSDHLVVQTGVAAQTADTQLDRLANLGYIWQPAGDDACEPGIPSLMTYVQAQLATAGRAATFASQQTDKRSECVRE